MPSKPGSTRTPEDTYAEELTNPKRGYPLYIPGPYDHLPGAYRRRGIQIGDVGVIRPDGGFEYFFSIACTKDDPINKDRYGVPDGFEVYSEFFTGPESSNSSESTPSIVRAAARSPRIRRVDDQYPNKYVIKSEHISSSHIEFNASASAPSPIHTEIGAGFEFSSHASSGAVLALPKGGSSTQYSAPDDLEIFVAKHSENWFKFVKKVTLERRLRTLSVIVGVHHATSWALASHSSESSSAGLSLKLKVETVAGVDGSYHLSWESSTSGDHRVCKPEQRKNRARQNQAIFITAIHTNDQSHSLMKRVKDAIRFISRAKGGRTVNPKDMDHHGSGRTSYSSGANQSSGSSASHHSSSPSDELGRTESWSRASDASNTSTNRSNPSEYPASEETTLSASDQAETDAVRVPDPLLLAQPNQQPPYHPVHSITKFVVDKLKLRKEKARYIIVHDNVWCDLGKKLPSMTRYNEASVLRLLEKSYTDYLRINLKKGFAILSASPEDSEVRTITSRPLASDLPSRASTLQPAVPPFPRETQEAMESEPLNDTTNRGPTVPSEPPASQSPQTPSVPPSFVNTFTSEPEAMPTTSQTSVNASPTNTLPPYPSPSLSANSLPTYISGSPSRDLEGLEAMAAQAWGNQDGPTKVAYGGSIDQQFTGKTKLNLERIGATFRASKTVSLGHQAKDMSIKEERTRIASGDDIREVIDATNNADVSQAHNRRATGGNLDVTVKAGGVLKHRNMDNLDFALGNISDHIEGDEVDIVQGPAAATVNSAQVPTTSDIPAVNITEKQKTPHVMPNYITTIQPQQARSEPTIETTPPSSKSEAQRTTQSGSDIKKRESPRISPETSGEIPHVQ